MSAVLAALLLASCGFTNPAAPEGEPSAGWLCLSGDPLCETLVSKQSTWCVEITGRPCDVLLSDQHPEWIAWVDFRDRPAHVVYWNSDVLRQGWGFLISDFRCAHEACHLEQPAVWSAEYRELLADVCARAHTGQTR